MCGLDEPPARSEDERREYEERDQREQQVEGSWRRPHRPQRPERDVPGAGARKPMPSTFGPKPARSRRSVSYASRSAHRC